MSDIAIKVENISKKYQIGENKKYPTLRDKLVELPSRLFKGPQKTKEFWALRDVSFEVKKGEVVGIIGRNGAGKSTMLKILARITEPTSGKITMYGRVASMLEVGTGFNPELTGRENIYLNGAIIGMTRQEIIAKFEDIVEFSGVGKFLDTPVKHYSSGMYVRLAFAVAAHLDADILLVDEVLAVGDAEFQKKCLGKMSDLAGSGKTVIFVSHNIGMIKNLCTKFRTKIFYKIKFDGQTDKALDIYIGVGKKITNNNSYKKNSELDLYLRKIWLTSTEGKYLNTFQINQSPQLWIEIEANIPTNKAEVSIQITNSSGVNIIFSSLSDFNKNKFYNFVPGIYQAKISIENNLLVPDIYAVSVTTHYRAEKRIELIEKAITFEIIESNSNMAPYGPASRSLTCIIKGSTWQFKKIE